MCSTAKTAVILAGGKSSRFGSDKALIETGEGPLIGFISRQLQNIFEKVIVNANDAEKYSFLNLPVIPDIIPGGGPLSGIHAGLQAADSGGPVFFTACDMPFLSPSLIEYMIKIIRRKEPPALVCSRNGFIEPLPGFYSQSVSKALEKYLRQGGGGIYSFLKREVYLPVEEDVYSRLSGGMDIFANINSPEDLTVLKSFFHIDV